MLTLSTRATKVICQCLGLYMRQSCVYMMSSERVMEGVPNSVEVVPPPVLLEKCPLIKSSILLISVTIYILQSFSPSLLKNLDSLLAPSIREF